MIYFSIFLLIAGIYFFILGFSNVIFLRRHMAHHVHSTGELVSVIIPARNEEKNIGNLLKSLTEQDYKNYEVLIIDDNSTDRTWDIIQSYVQKYPNFRAFKGAEKPKDKKVNGKTYALSQLVPHTRGSIIFATDADTIHHHDSISRAVALLREHNLDLISGFPKENCPTFIGSCIISAMNFAVVAYVPLYLAYYHPMKLITLANGQFMVMKKSALLEVGGYESIVDKLTDDVGLSREFIKKGKRYALLRVSHYTECNMYNNTKEAFAGISRSIGGIFPGKLWILPPILLVVALLLAIAFSPIIAIVLGVLGYTKACVFTALGCILFTLSWYNNCRAQNFSRVVSASWPLTLVLICVMFFKSYFNNLFGKKVIWKDREV